MSEQPKNHMHRLNDLAPQPESEKHRPLITAAGPAKDMGKDMAKDMGAALNEDDRQRIREWAPGFKEKHEKTFRVLAG